MASSPRLPEAAPFPSDGDLGIEVMVEAGAWPGPARLEEAVARAAEAVFAETRAPPGVAELSVVFTDDPSVRTLNARWRGMDKATNVLSFPSAAPGPMLGDVVLAFETVEREAALDGKPFEHHMTHLLVHGILHLLGFDHEDDAEAERMEAIERRALARLGIPDPYSPDAHPQEET